MFQSIPEALFYYAEATPQKTVLADDFSQQTYAEFALTVKKYCRVLKDMGVARDNKLVIEAKQNISYLAMQMAVYLCKGIFVPLELNCSAEKLKNIAELTNASVIITDKTFDTERSVYSYAEMSKLCESASPVTCTLPCGNDIAEILFSTGTTGKEKGIVITHKNNIALAQNVINGVKMSKDNVELIPSPMNHSHGLRRYYANIYNGSSVVLLGSVMNVNRLFYCLDTFGVNSMDLVPAALSVILKLTKGKLGEYKDSLRYIQLGAAPLPDADKEAVCMLLPNTRIYNFYGSTESGCTFIYDFNVPNSKNNCIGRPTVNTKPFLVDENRKTVVGTSGLLATEGSMNMLGYFMDDQETQKALVNGIVYSNDIAYYDSDGDVILLGRNGDIINVGGKKVCPEEIESVAKTMACIEDCGCVPMSDSSRGQVPKLFVQLKEGYSFDPIAIRKYLAESLEPYKVPIYIEQIASIPRSFNGKLLRKELV